MTPAERIKRIFGHGGLSWFAGAVGVNVNTVTKWNQNGWPDYALAHIEWLEDTPERFWPERWRKPQQIAGGINRRSQ